VRQLAGATPWAARPKSAPIVAAVLAVALATWAVTIANMRGMDAGPGTDLGGLGWFMGVWVTMMAAMMLPSTTPMVVAVGAAASARGRGRPPRPVAVALFVLGYLGAWSAYGLIAYGGFRLIAARPPDVIGWDRAGPWLAGAAVATAGVYQLTPLKQACLRHCRTPLHFVMHRWRPGAAGAVAMGLEHGAWCVGCCLGLMLALFAVGVMSLTWMAVVTAVVFAEKVLPGGLRLTLPVAATLLALGAAIALAPGSVPGLVEPGSMSGMSMGSMSPTSPPGGR
jgi:predicted metal-binding membrane protein